MRVKEAIYSIATNPHYQKIKEIEEMPVEQWKAKRYNVYVYPYRYNNPQDNYTHDRHNYIKEKLLRHVPGYRLKFYIETEHFDFQVVAEVKASMHHKCKIESRLMISDPFGEHRYYTLDQSQNLTEKAIRQVAINHIKDHYFLAGIFQYLQLRWNYSKKEAIQHYKNYYYNARETPIDEDKAKAKIEKRFNVKSYVSLEDTIKAVNRIGKQGKRKTISNFCFPDLWNFDGNEEELLGEIYSENSEPDTIYV